MEDLIIKFIDTIKRNNAHRLIEEMMLVANVAAAEFVEKQTKNASLLANELADNQYVNWVRYPFLPDHPQHTLAKKQSC